MKFEKIIIIAQQETLRERPRVRKFGHILQSLDQPFEIWKVGPPDETTAEGMQVRNLMTNEMRQHSPLVRYMMWMLKVFVAALGERKNRAFLAVGFDSAFALSWIPFRSRPFMFDNVDNIAMSYRMPSVLKATFTSLERWISYRARIHSIPSQDRLVYGGENIRVVINTPSRSAMEAAKNLAATKNYSRRGSVFTIYVNGWLSSTRGLGTLLRACKILEERNVEIKIIVAGRLACPDADTLVTLPNVEYFGMLTNEEALAHYYQSNLAFIFYDPCVQINLLAESQKWTDCWATGTAFVSNQEILTLAKFTREKACYALPYEDAGQLADLIERLVKKPASTQEVSDRLCSMNFRFWDDEMRKVVLEWTH